MGVVVYIDSKSFVTAQNCQALETVVQSGVHDRLRVASHRVVRLLPISRLWAASLKSVPRRNFPGDATFSISQPEMVLPHL
jgi:hypothetical protein